MQPTKARMFDSNRRLWALCAILCFSFGIIVHYKVHFEWTLFFQQMHAVNFYNILLAVIFIYISVFFRAFRWSALLAPTKKVNAPRLVGPQFIGFSCVALFGSLGDLVRPYLIAKKVGLPLSSQIATYTIERMFDLATAALIFSGAFILAPKGFGSRNDAIFLHVGTVSFAAVIAIFLMAVCVRSWGEAAAFLIERRFGGGSFAVKITGKLRSFRGGLITITSMAAFVRIFLISLAIWLLVALAYVQVVRAFPQTAQLASLTFSQTMLLLAASIGGSLVQLPVVGWFTQIAATAATMHAVFQVPLEAATACGALLLGVTFIFLIPGGVMFARSEGISLSGVVGKTEDVDR